MLSTGRRLEDVNAMPKDWECFELPKDKHYREFKIFYSWRGKAERHLDNKWESHPIKYQVLRK